MKLQMFFRRGHEKARLDQELEFHLQQQISENVSAGMPPEEARMAALRRFGNPTLLNEEARSAWSWNWLEGLWRDLRYGSRTLLRTPGFSLTAVLVMALGIGAATSLFTVVRSVLLKSLPFKDPEKLVMVYEHFRQQRANPYNVVSPGDFLDWRAQTHGFQDMAAWHRAGFNITGSSGDLPEMVNAIAGTSNIFSVLGVDLALGRTFTADEDRFGANKVTILTWSLFKTRFGGDPNIVGQTVRLDSVPYTVVGVLPEWFSYPGPQVKLWVPYVSMFTQDGYHDHGNHQSYVIARQKDGTSIEAATGEVTALQYQLHLQNMNKPVAEDAISRPLIDDVVKDVKTPLNMLMAAVACMLLIACLNVSNLLVARSAARRKEVAVRGALGGSRWKLVQEQVTESFLICVAGGTLGLFLSIYSTRWLATHWHDLPRADSVHVDWMVALFSVVASFITALLAGLLPALASTGKGLLASLQDSSRSIGGSASKAGLRKILLTAEIALTVVLLVSAGLLFRSFVNLRTSDLGCATENVLTMQYGLPDSQYDRPEKIVNFHEAVLQRVRALPGVSSAGLVSRAPGDGWESDSVFSVPEHPSTDFKIEQDALTRKVDPGYFNTLQIGFVKGRNFTEQDRLGRTQNILVSKKFVDWFFPSEDPIGKHVKIHWAGKDTVQEIIGVVGDTLHDVGEPTEPTIYFPILSGALLETGDATLVVRTARDPLAMALSVQKQIASVDPELAVFSVLTLPQIIARETSSQNFSASLVLSFATLSLLLAAVGLYGVLSYLVTQRVPEIGIRMALGAQRSEVLRLVLVDGMRPVVLGLVIGLVGGALAGTLIKSLLFGTSPLDPAVFIAMVASLVVTSAIASAVPALRACRVQPTQALRSE